MLARLAPQCLKKPDLNILTDNGKRNEGFVFDPNGDQFPPISAQDRFDDLGEIHDCLDQDIGDKRNRNVEYEKSANRSDDSASKSVYQDKVDKIVEKESDANMGSNRGVWDKKFADIVNANKIDNKLMEISTEIDENGNEVVVLNDEMIESGCEKRKNTICGFFVGGQVTYSEARYHLRRMWNKFGYLELMKNDGGSVKGINALASSLGKPIIMDDMTARMCTKGEGRINFARVLIEVEAGKGLKKEIEVFGHDNKNCMVKEREMQDTFNEQNMNNNMKFADRPFSVVKNRKVNYEKVNENKSYNKWNGYNGDKSMGNSNGESDLNGSNKEGTNEVHEDIMDKSKGKSTLNESNGKCIGDEDLILSIEHRKIVDNYTNKENEGDNINSQGCNNEVKRYYRDRKELFGAAKEMEMEEDVEEVYASNSYVERRKLWRELIQRNISNGDPWVIIGDFNVSLNMEEMSNGSFVLTNEMNEFLECTQEIEVEDILSSRFHFTWTKSRGNPKCKTLKNLDRIMINEAFMEKFPASHGIFLPYLVSDHFPAVLKLPNGMMKNRKAFRFSNFMTDKKEFLPNVKEAWKIQINGHMMYKVECQVEVDRYPHDENIKTKSCKVLNEYYEAMNDENSLLMQKAKVEWLKDGDRNTISDEAQRICRGVSEVEIKNAMFDIKDSKAPGPDGFTARLYKSAWSIIGKDMCKAIQEFFVTGKLLGERNSKELHVKIDLQKLMILLTGVSLKSYWSILDFLERWLIGSWSVLALLNFLSILMEKGKDTSMEDNNNSGIRASNDPGKNKCRRRSKERKKKKDSKERELKQQRMNKDKNLNLSF
ncbi:ribonuclease H-like domain-containing protein [Tanacetum coccineum]|uniref:Ribonuclease H-like domain-containing protein n=1 Tax=Tanacetum coccineum TaxID=301880 RepID=A0ABQ5CHI0_9ASTR